MSFDAGAVTGSLSLDISDYSHGMIEAEGLMRAFPPLVVEFLENPLIGMIAVAREAGEALLDMTTEVLNAANETGLMAQKTGTSVEYFSKLSWAAKEVNVSAEQLAVGMRMLQMRAAEAVQQGGEAAQQFNRFGISTRFLSENLNNSEGLMRKMTSVMDGLHSSAEKTDAAMRLMGRSGAELVPLLSMGSNAIDEIGEKARQFGALEDDASAQTGAAWKKAATEMDMAWEGLKKTFAESLAPVLIEQANEVSRWMAQHGPEIRAEITQIAKEVEKAWEDIKPILAFLLDNLDTVIKVFGAAGIGYVVASAMRGLAALGAEFLALAADIGVATAAEEGFAAASAAANAASRGGPGGGAFGGMRGSLGSMGGSYIGYQENGVPGSIAGAVGGGGGAIMGGEVGAATGTAIMPGIGTILGGLIGAIGGMYVGAEGAQVPVGVYHYIHGDVKVDPSAHADEHAKKVGEEVGKQIEKSVTGQYGPIEQHYRQAAAQHRRQMVARATGALAR